MLLAAQHWSRAVMKIIQQVYKEPDFSSESGQSDLLWKANDSKSYPDVSPPFEVQDR